jgi:hypothetical protein
MAKDLTPEQTQLDEAVLQHVLRPGYQPVKPRVIAKKLGLEKDLAAEVKKSIKRLVRAGRLVYGASHLVKPVPPSSPATTNQIVGTSKLGYRDLTPLNILMREYVVAWVHAESPIASAKEVIARLRKDPASLSFGFATAPGNQNHIDGMLKAAGVDPWW